MEQLRIDNSETPATFGI